MANQFLNETVYANTMLLLLKNELHMGRLVDGQYKNQVNDENGLVINVKRPPRFAGNDSSALDANLAAQDVLTGSVSIAVNQYAKVHIGIGDIEYVQSYNALMQNETMKSAASRLAHQVDAFLQNKTLGFHSWVAGSSTGGTNASDPSKVIASPTQFFSAYTRLKQQGAPDTGLSSTILFQDGELIRGSLTGGFIQGVNKSALETTQVPLMSAVKAYCTQQCPSLTTGTRATGDGASSGAQIDGANQNVNYRDVKTTMTQTILLKGAGNAATVKAGEVFTIQNVYAWDWRNNQKLDYLQQFTVLEDNASSSGGAITLKISPAIIVQGTSDGVDTNGNTAFATVDSKPADSAYIKYVGSASTAYRVRTAFHKQAIALVSTPLHKPFTGVSSFAQDPETGISLRYWRSSDISSGKHYHRWDMMFGAAVTDPFLGTRVCGT